MNQPHDRNAINSANDQPQSRDALWRSDQRYRALIEATSQAVWSWSPHGGATEFDRAQKWWEELTGQSIEQQQRSEVAWLDVLHPSDRLLAQHAWERAIANREIYEVVYRVRGRLGGWKYVRARGVPILGLDNSVREWIGTLDDVTAQHEVATERERLLSAAETERRRLEEVFRHAPSFMAVLRGPNHIFERANDRHIQLIGGRDVIGLPVIEALPELAEQGYVDLLDRVYQTGKPHVAVDARVVFQNPGAESERILQFVYQPMVDIHGRVTGVIVQGIDMTEQRQAEAGLAKVMSESQWQRRMYETVLTNTADFVYLIDTSGRLIYVNKRLLDIWDKQLSEVVGKTFFDLDYPHELADRLQRQIEQVIATGRKLRDETLYAHSKGVGYYEYIFVPVFNSDGKVEAVAGSTRDITERRRSEEAIRQSEQQHRALVTATSDVIFSMDAKWEQLQPLDGRGFLATTESPTDSWMQSYVPVWQQPAIRSAVEKAIEQKSMVEMEHQVIRADGTIGWSFSRAIPVFDDSGQLAKWFGTARDVSRRKQAEEELQDIKSRMEAALEAGAIGTWSWDVVSDQFYGDSSLAQMFSIAPENVAGNSLSKIVLKIHPDDRTGVQRKIEQVLRAGDRYEASYRVVNDDGTWKWITARGKIERDAVGNAIRFPGVVIDVTEWKLAEEKLARLTEESERRKRLYETFLSSIPDLAYVFDLDHKFSYANDVLLKMWGRTWDEAIGKTCHELGYEKWHAEMHDREIEQVIMTRQPLRGEVPFDGTFGRRDYEYIFVPVIGKDGEVEAVAGTTRDVTDRKLAEEALRDVARRKDDFLAMLAHELRNPLAPIRNGLQVMRLAHSDADAIASVREMMERQLAHLVRLIDDLLDISRITRNKMQLRRTHVSIAEIVDSAVETASPSIEEAGHHLDIDLPANPILLFADLTRMAQVFSNLLNNSAKYTPHGGNIRLSVHLTSDDHVSITVSDNGIGIPTDALPTLFDMFSQVDRTVERSSGGLGIGLSLVKGLVEMHGGSVSASSVEGSGSSFTVRLPVIKPAVATSSATTKEDTMEQSKRRILVVDDNRDGANSMAIVLRLLGNEVATAHDGLEAIEIAESYSPEIILMDIGLPRLNGLDATRQIREKPWGKTIKIIALTGWGQENDRQRSHSAGCNGHLVKPVNLPDLQTMLAEFSGD